MQEQETRAIGRAIVFLHSEIGYTPPPPIYWNHRISAEMRINLFGSASYGQNPDVKELRA
jgi:hypothetical protein